MPQTAAIDPRLKEIANLVRTERRTAACVLLYLAAIILFFWYRQQSDPEADYQALKNTGRIPQREKTST
jgi:hypothetical protein